MRDESSMGTKEFLMKCAFYGALAMIWYRNLLFRCLGNLTYKESKILLWSMLVGYILLEGLVFFRNHRTSWTVIVTLLLPYGFYTGLTYMRTIGTRIKIIFVISVVFALSYMILVMTRKVRNQRKKKQIFIKRFCRCLSDIQSFIAVGMAIIMLPLFLKGVFGTAIFKSSVKATNANGMQKQTVDNNIDVVLLLRPTEWEELNTEEKLDVLQTIANIEADYLGLPNELNVGAANLNEYTLAAYADNTHMIYINLEHLENASASELLNSCCHEAWHSYEHRLVEAYNKADISMRNLCLYRKAAVYSEEFGSYVGGAENFCSYYFQQCESDAREYAEVAVADYYSKIKDYLDMR